MSKYKDTQTEHGDQIRRAIYDFMLAYENEHGQAPPVRAIMDAVGLNSTGAINYQLGVMVSKGMLYEIAPRGYPYRLRVVRDEVSE